MVLVSTFTQVASQCDAQLDEVGVGLGERTSSFGNAGSAHRLARLVGGMEMVPKPRRLVEQAQVEVEGGLFADAALAG